MGVAATLIGAALTACGRAPAEPLSNRRYELADTLVVENLRPTIPDTLHPVAVTRYGRADGPPEYLFSTIRSFAVDDEGSVYVYDPEEGIRRYSVDGEYRGLVARAGRGPDEVEGITAMGATGIGRVAVIDVANQRVAAFAPQRSAWSVPTSPGHTPRGGEAIVFRDDGSLWVRPNAVFPESGGIVHPRPAFVRAGPGGSYPDTVYTPASIAYHCPRLSSLGDIRGFWEDWREPYVPKVKWALGPDGTFVVGCPASYRFYVYRPDGTVLRVARARPKVEVTAEERAFRDRMPMPKAEATLPAYVRLLAPDGERIWVWPSQPDVKEPVHPEVAERFGVTHTWDIAWRGAFDVFSEDGEWLAVVALPPLARYSGYPTEPDVVIRGDTLWAVEKDALDVQTVVRYTVPGLTR